MPITQKNKTYSIKPFITGEKGGWWPLLLLVFAVILIRLPAYTGYSIDDVAHLIPSDANTDKINFVFLRWNRYIVYLQNMTLSLFGEVDEGMLSVGYFFASAGLVLFIHAITKLFDLRVSWFNYVLMAYFSLFPIHYILLHFTLIQFSMFFVLIALTWLIHSHKGEVSLLRSCLSTCLVTVIIGGAYQSGLYFLFLTAALLVYHQSRSSERWIDFFKRTVAIGVGIVLGFIIYYCIGKFVAQYVPPRSQFSPRAINEIIPEFTRRLSYFRWLVRDIQFLPSGQQSLSVIFSGLLFGGLFFSKLTNKFEKTALIFILITFGFCIMQLLTLPVQYNAAPIRSFWFLPLVLVFASVLFLDKTRLKTASFWRAARYSVFGVVTFFALVFAHQTMRQNAGYTALRTQDKLAAEHIEKEVKALSSANKAIYITWSNRAQINKYHRGTMGSMRTLFWAEWSKYDYLNFSTDLKNPRVRKNTASKAVQKACLPVKNVDLLPKVIEVEDVIVVCF